MVLVSGFNYELSDKKGKKLMTVVNGKKIHFGAEGYKHFFDRTGLLPTSLNHLDDKRRQNYLKRSGGIGRTEDPTSANWHARNILW
jgi:hypothetical protein